VSAATKLAGRDELLAALDLAPVMIREVDGCILHWSSGLARIYGYRPDEAIGRVSHALLATVFPEPLGMIERRLAASGAWAGELRHRLKDGSVLVVASQWTLYGDAPVVIEVNADLSALQRSEEQRLQLADLVASSADAIVGLSLDGTIMSWNRGAERMIGYGAADAIGRKVDMLAVSDGGDDTAALLARVAHGEIIEAYETQRRRRDGSAIEVAVTLSPIRDSGGAVIGASEVARDITRQKTAERATLELAASLEQRVDERTRQLEDANEQLEVFAHSVAHDLRAPLRTMSGFAEALLEDFAADLPPLAVDYASRVRDGARRLDVLIEDLLKYSRLGREGVRLQPVGLDGLVDQIVEQSQRTIADKAAAVTVVRPMPVVLGHPSLIAQAVGNLVANALKYTRPGSSPVVRLRAERCPGGVVRLWVEDEGIGIAPEHRARVFELFQRLHSQAAFPGTGIGLAIVRRAAELMGGRVGIATAPGAGSHFWIDFKEATDGRSG